MQQATLSFMSLRVKTHEKRAKNAQKTRKNEHCHIDYKMQPDIKTLEHKRH